MSIKGKGLRGFAFAALGVIIWIDKRHKHFATVFFPPNFELARSWETKNSPETYLSRSFRKGAISNVRTQSNQRFQCSYKHSMSDSPVC